MEYVECLRGNHWEAVTDASGHHYESVLERLYLTKMKGTKYFISLESCCEQ